MSLVCYLTTLYQQKTSFGYVISMLFNDSVSTEDFV